MPYHVDGYDWVWMIPMMLFWLAVLGAIVYIAVRVGNQDSRHNPR